ncbi:MAG: ribonuclease III [Bacilli bacterium]|nr:ribonuclease III [Bacilli bacterium]
MELLEQFNIIPRNKELYEHAFLHSSYCNEHHLANNYERLEFLGDKVLDLVISEYLYRKKDFEEGQMTKVRAGYVCENALYEYALSLKFNEYVKVGKGEENSGGKFRKAILADTFESFMGAVYLDQGLNKVKEIINKVIIPILENESEVFFNDYKSMLQELVQLDKRTVEYELVSQTGPAHSKTFTVVVRVDGINYGTGVAKTKKEAEQEAAHDALNKQAK